MSSDPTESTDNQSMNASQIQPKEITVEEYSDLVAKWQQAYYTWNVNCMSYHNMMVLRSSQQFFQQIPILTSTNLIAMITENNRLTILDPLTEIRNARLKVAPVWRRFIAETIDFVLLHILKILVIFLLSTYFDIIDESRLTLTYIISNLLYDEAFSFPMELICIEFTYIVASITFESFCLTRYGATPGKRLLRLRVLKCDHLQMQDNGDLIIEPGTMLNTTAAFTRSSFKSLMSIFLLPAVIVALMTSQHRQTSYDMAANSVVVELESRE
ncbi:unnamed protein product [Adineta ricciae]|uniref:RDD domain-containing protein n=1 Tax=Adineta ricciae TaxID=249248 RepID=A0A814QIZ7_ADIRI|nr:unnamed protein product [Adineta ricciae]CAF1609469.1 unnamed protein product [Adineta ricciae]